MGALSWLLASRSSTAVAREGVPAYAMDAVARALAAQGYALVSTPPTPQAASYRDVATQQLEARFEPVVRPKHAQEVHSIAVRQRDDRTLRVTVGFGATRTAQVVGAALAVLVAVALHAMRREYALAGLLLYHPLAVAIVCLLMPGRTNAEATRAVVATVERALQDERARAVDSVRRRVEAPTGPRGQAEEVAPEEAAPGAEAQRRGRGGT